MKKISVALCTYNGAHFLPAQLESILSQTLIPDELVIGDDCSTDSTVSAIEEFAARAPFPVRLHVNNCNLGSTRNFENTILRCEGDTIALCDQDDVWLPTKLSKLDEALNRDPGIGLVFSNAELVSESLQPLGHHLWEIHFRPDEQETFIQGRWLDVLLARNVVTGATLAFRSAFRDVIYPIPSFSTIIHDGWIAMVVGAFAKLAFIDEPLILYRQHERQQLGVALDSLKTRTQRPACSVIGKNEYGASIDLLNQRITELTQPLRVLTEIQNRAISRSVRSLAVDNLLDIQRKKIDAVRDVIAHYKIRGEFSANRRERTGQVLEELFSGRYHRYSGGVLSALKDMVK